MLLRIERRLSRDYFKWIIRRFVKLKEVVKGRSDVKCYEKVIKVVDLPVSLLDLDPQDLQHFMLSYLNSINLGFSIEIRSLISPVRNEDFIEKLNRRIETLELVLNSNPANEALRSRLRILRKIRDIALKGFPPLKIETEFILKECGEDSSKAYANLNSKVEALVKSLNSLGVKTVVSNNKLNSLKNLTKLFKGVFKSVNLTLMTLNPASFMLLPFMLSDGFNEVRGNFEGVEVLLGTHLIRKTLVFWNVDNAVSPHIVVVGPTGSGKTEFFVELVERFYGLHGIPSLIVDIKNEYSTRLSRRQVPYKVLTLGNDIALGLCNLVQDEYSEVKASSITDLITNAYALSEEVASALNELLTYSLSSCDNYVLNAIQNLALVRDPYIRFKLSKVLSELSIYEVGEPLFNRLRFFLNGYEDKVLILNLSKAFFSNVNVLNLAVLSLLKSVKKALLLRGVNEIPHNPDTLKFLVFDEAWIYSTKLRDEVEGLIRYLRSYGLIIGIATQHPQDLISLGEVIVGNAGLFVAMGSNDLSYWKHVKRYVRIEDKDVSYYCTSLRRGEAICRLAGSKGMPIDLTASTR
ncbi:MAG: hypothetical protein B7O98_02010 [Zestosphaera tikiterensis]|uniref:Helicase HerA central domain-containing protein n=1 Tax=Zestosphaera tikiterensis TaxID=1973259 RepID=A0A2R7Y8Q0_9CREN|nr:MAG: hypothetical protein B7O98_02010 [Zestosphaera tikiterensis]